MIYNSFLFFHIIGITLLAGITLADWLAFRQFWNQYQQDKTRAAGVVHAISIFQQIMGAGMGLLILSGLGMMIMTGGSFGGQLWFRIKFGLVLAIIINALLVGRRVSTGIRKSFEEDQSGDSLTLMKSKLTRFHTIQLLMFLLIFALSVFKFT